MIRCRKFTFSERLIKEQRRRRRFRQVFFFLVCSLVVLGLSMAVASCYSPLGIKTASEAASPAKPIEPVSVKEQQPQTVNLRLAPLTIAREERPLAQTVADVPDEVSIIKTGVSTNFENRIDAEEKEAETIKSPKIREAAPQSFSRASFRAYGTPAVSMNADFFSALESGEASIEEAGRRYQLTINPSMQRFSQGLLRRSRVPWGAIVALEPDTGRVLVLAGYSEREKEQGGRLTVRSGFPAASLFKVVTASAAVEKSGLSGSTPVFFRGGNYTLNKYNYAPNSRLDRRKMDLASALGKSCNPVFGRVGLNVLSSAELSRFAQGFGFNQMIPFEIPVEMSKFTAPENDFEVARTAAGFGPAYVSPLHSALLAATVANGGTMMRPQLVSEVVDSRGRVIYQAQPQVLRHVLLETTADSVLEMMETTVSQGTARRYFSRWQKSDLGNIRVAAKTGTLRGPDPEGVYHWFIAAAPLRQPEIAVSCLVIDPGTARVGATALCREMMEQYFRKNRAEGRVVRSSKSPGKSVS